MSPEDAVADGVMLRTLVVGVLSAIDLDHQPAREADEVEKVSVERKLPANVKAARP